MKNSEFPNLAIDQFALAQVEASTGAVFNLEGSYFRKDSGHEKYIIFDSLEKAKSFVLQQDKVDIEYLLFDYNEEVVYHKEVHLDKNEKGKKPWWKIWL